MVSAGYLDQRVEVLTPEYTGRSIGGQQVVTWKSEGTRAAAVKYLKGSRLLEMGDVWLPSTVVITMRYTDKVTERSMLIWNKKRYRIVAPPNGTLREGTLTITADLVNDGQQGIEPKAEEDS